MGFEPDLVKETARHKICISGIYFILCSETERSSEIFCDLEQVHQNEKNLAKFTENLQEFEVWKKY